MRRTVRSVSCNVGSDQLFDQLSRRHLQRGGSVEITSRGLSVYHTTSCCFLKTFCSTCPSGLSEHCTSRTPSRLTESCVPGSSNYELQAYQTHFNTIPLCYHPLSYLLYLSQQPIDWRRMSVLHPFLQRRCSVLPVGGCTCYPCGYSICLWPAIQYKSNTRFI